MLLKKIVLHQLIKLENGPPNLNCSDHLLDSKDPIVIDFVKELIKSFSSKHPTYGTFKDNEENYPFQTKVKKYLRKNDFLEFTEQAMEILKKEIDIPQAIGGYVVFAHYEEKSVDFLLTAMLDKSSQFGINDTSLNIAKLQTLAIDKLARANRLNIKNWEINEQLYLAFIKGTREVSKYFQKFIGNTDLTSSMINTKNLKRALNKYMRENKYTEDKKELIFRKIYYYFQHQLEKDLDVELESISAFANTYDTNDFKIFIQNDEDLNVSGCFRVAKKSDFNLFHKAVIEEEGYKLVFEKSLKQKGKIIRQDNNIVIQDVPESILDIEFGELINEN